MTHVEHVGSCDPSAGAMVRPGRPDRVKGDTI